VSLYARPSIEAPVFHDADGRAIDYGNRWGAGPPPEETYSVETHLERFAPTHTIAHALIAHLRDSYDADVEEGVEAAADLLHGPAPAVVHAVRVRPNDPACASLTFVFTAYPGIHLHAGLLNDFQYPICGCDACDSTWSAEADEMERQVFAVVAGRYRETVEQRGSDPWVGYAFTYLDGGSSGGSREQGMPADRLEAATSILRNRPDEWAAWPTAPLSSARAPA